MKKKMFSYYFLKLFNIHKWKMEFVTCCIDAHYTVGAMKLVYELYLTRSDIKQTQID